MSSSVCDIMIKRDSYGPSIPCPELILHAGAVCGVWRLLHAAICSFKPVLADGKAVWEHTFGQLMSG